jgi:hypothetical protein
VSPGQGVVAMTMKEAFLARAGADRPGSECPEPERIWSAARGESPGKEVRALLDHVSNCGACAEAWLLARELGGAPASAKRRYAPVWAVAAAAVVLLAVIVPVLRREAPGPTPVFRDEGRAAIRSLVSEDRALRRADCVLEWSPGPENSRYHLELAGEQHGLLPGPADLEEPVYRIPPEDLAPLASGERLLWRVKVIVPDGSETDSATFVNTVE